MKSIYKFGFEISKNHFTWIKIFDDLFNIDLKDITFETSNVNKEKNWNETFKNLEVLKQRRIFLSYELISIHCAFNRYQERVYLTLIFDGKIDDSSKISEYIKERVPGAFDNFFIPFKEPDLYVDYTDKRKYQEIISLENPVYILENSNQIVGFEKEPLKHEDLNFDIYYNIEYRQSNKNKYERVFRQVYVTESIDNIENILEHFHSVFVLFHRAESHFKDLEELDEPSELLTRVSDQLNKIWPKERIKLFLINRFIHASLYNKTFYSVLELNAQMDSIFSQIRIKYQKIEDKYEKQYERVFYNFTMSDDGADVYYNKIKDYLLSPSKHRKKVLERINDFFEPTNAQIERLRSDNDSKVNFAIQWIMSILSVIIFFWGISTFWYQGIMEVESPITDKFMENINWIPGNMLLLIMVTLLTFTGFIFYFLIHNSSLTSKDMKKTIRDNSLDVDIFEKNILKAKEHKDKESKKTLLMFTETFKLLTTHLIMNFDHAEKDLKKYMDLIDEIE